MTWGPAAADLVTERAGDPVRLDGAAGRLESLLDEAPDRGLSC